MTNTSSRTKALGLWTGLALVVGNMVGSSAYLLPSTFAQWGSISLFGFVVAATGALSLAAVFARLGRLRPSDGGHYAYTREAFGDVPAFLVAWGYWASCWIGNASIAVATVGYLAVFVPAIGASPASTAGAALGLIWILTALNMRGLREAALFQLVVTILKVAPLVLIATVGLLWIEPANLTPLNVSGGSGTQAITAAAVFALWGFLGFESLTVPAGEVEAAERTIPRVTLIGTGVTALIYLLSALVVMGVMSVAELASSTVPVADAAARMWGAGAGTLVAAGATLAGIGVLNGWVIMQGQMPRAPARDGLFPPAFARLNARGAPAFGLLVSSLLCTVLVAANYTRGLIGLFEFALLLATVTVLVPYAFTAAAQIVLIRRDPEQWGGADSSRAIVTSLVGLTFSLLAIVWAGATSILMGGLLLVLGLPFFFWSRTRAAGQGEGR